MKEDLDKLLVPGKKLRIFYHEGNRNNCIIHIRSIVDETHIVYRVWNKYWRSWFYIIQPKKYFSLLLEEGYLSKAK